MLSTSLGRVWTRFAEKGDYSKVTAKVFGDTISKYTGFAIDDIAKRLMSNQELPSNTVPGQINFTSAEKFVSYKTSLESSFQHGGRSPYEAVGRFPRQPQQRRRFWGPFLARRSIR